MKHPIDFEVHLLRIRISASQQMNNIT